MQQIDILALLRSVLQREIVEFNVLKRKKISLLFCIESNPFSTFLTRAPGTYIRTGYAVSKFPSLRGLELLSIQKQII